MGRHHSRGGGHLNSQRRAPCGIAVLITDRGRQGPPRPALLTGLRRGDLVIFRDYDAPDRPLLGRLWRRLTRARGIGLLVAGDRRLALALDADGQHLPGHRLRRPEIRHLPRPLPASAAVHDRRDLVRARRRGADLLLISPVLPTRSHPGARVLGPLRFRALARQTDRPVVALGGMDQSRMRQLHPCRNLAGFAAIDAFGRAD